jgi:hypothetical protein
MAEYVYRIGWQKLWFEVTGYFGHPMMGLYEALWNMDKDKKRTSPKLNS